MKKFLLALGMAACAPALHAQITLNQSNMPWPSVSTTYNYAVVGKVSTDAAPTSGADQTWDYSALADSGVSSFTLAPNTNSDFSSSAFDNNTSINVTPVYGIYATQVRAQDANGYYLPGYFTAKSGYSLYAYTGGANDSFYVPAQSIVYKNRQDIISYPATFKSTWGSSNYTTLNFAMTIAAAGLNMTPCSKVSTVTVGDSVAGWGNLIIPSPNKASIPYPVLMVKQVTMTTDSYYVAGYPAPQPLLSAFGVSANGATTADYRIYFYSADRTSYLYSVDYGTDNTYTKPQYAYYSTDNVQSGIESPENNLIGFSEYPNPANGSINCKMTKMTSGQWTLSLVNTLGQTVKTQNLNGTGNLQIPVNVNGLSNGLYFMNVTNENGAVEASSKVDIR